MNPWWVLGWIVVAFVAIWLFFELVVPAVNRA